MKQISAAAAAELDLKLAEEIADFYADPLGFVLYAYPWGDPGPLQKLAGPDDWQRDVLTEIGEEVRRRGFDGVHPVDPIRDATASGHGIGKSTLVAWIVDWIMSTRPGCRGTITANTVAQLRTKTWAAIQYWSKLLINAHWFRITTERMMRVGQEEDWFCSAQTCKEENSEAFAGQHAATSSSFYIFDEASAVPDKIYEVAEGGLTDGESMEFMFGNPTRNTGKFYRAVFGAEQHLFKKRSIDSRTVRITNKKTLETWLTTYGEESDFFKVRVRGLPPSASELQFIDNIRVEKAQKRIVHPLEDEPLVAGFDVSGGGSAWNVIRFRRGPDARSIPPIRIAGEKGRDRNVLVGICAELLRDTSPERKIAMMFVDSAFGSPIVERLKVMGFRNVEEVNFGNESPDFHQENQRAYMWNKLKDWLQLGAIPADDGPQEPEATHTLAAQICGPGYHINRRNRLVIESKQQMKDRGEASPDDADALCLTFAQPVAPRPKPKTHELSVEHGSLGAEWMG